MFTRKKGLTVIEKKNQNLNRKKTREHVLQREESLSSCPREIKTLILNQKLQKQPFGGVSEN